ncbi:hypothetical protein M529_08940 [Sphingobium ummariense RL-3]|uniref:Uncharacterized protein n=1 Tax=Sphingobium ummariense RL-3 TaxID=1346791 RepID=T0J3N0_9SPHN|nr:hypothetical protein M529_08940 [Sphingobium ummariense RL-3]
MSIRRIVKCLIVLTTKGHFPKYLFEETHGNSDRQMRVCRLNFGQITVVPLRTMAQLISTFASFRQMAVTRL